MGVRFPLQQQRPDFEQMQQVQGLQQGEVQEEPQAPARAETRESQAVETEAAVREAREPQAAEQEQPVERSAGNAGVQTPGSIIDILA